MPPTELELLGPESSPVQAEPLCPAASPTQPRALPETTTVFGLPLARLSFEGTVNLIDQLVAHREPCFFITANLHYAMLCDRLEPLRAVNRQAAFLVADGMPLVWASRLTNQPLTERVTGADLVWALARRAAERGYRLFLLGGEPGIAERAAQRLQSAYPGLVIAGVAAPQWNGQDGEQLTETIEQIRTSRADLLLVAFGQPKGELWLADHHRQLQVPVSVQVGASFDFICGRRRRAPRWMQRLGTEWLYRLLSEPRRLLPRYAANACFLGKALSRQLLRRRRP